MNNETRKFNEMGIYVEAASDDELELMVGGKDGGYVKTLTKDCPNIVSKVCIGIVPLCKNCK
ncbi:type A2 lantipeptide [Clostridium sporogenes]|uniref:type A2 lanthipeptide n=1 Tax=unclassified Clostridium TaxID=2614128 RepID=UPI0013D08034|nr:type A2 lantipeptide [Clostridium sporogenes]NFS25682.1 type A2 lantipeptide [Clostridium sporogenes]